jgi:hypothetical protein
VVSDLVLVSEDLLMLVSEDLLMLVSEDLLMLSVPGAGMAVVSVAEGVGAGAATLVSVVVAPPGTAPVSPLDPDLLQPIRAAATIAGNATVCHFIGFVLSSVTAHVALAMRT